jgi:hypothetical protein
VKLSHSNDTKVLFAGVGAFVALVAYLAVAFVNTHAASLPTASPNHIAPWTPWGSNLIPVRLGKAGRYAVRVTAVPRETRKVGAYGALVPTLIPQPTPGTRFVVGLTLKGARPGQVGVQIQKFRAGSPSRYLVETVVSVQRKWSHFTFRGKVRGRWTGVSIYVYRLANVRARPSFEIRDLTVELR